MKLIITGSLGHISKPLVTTLARQGHLVTVISSKPEKKKDIELSGADAAIGSVEDVSFLTATFTGADAVYTMVPPANYFDHNVDAIAHYRRLGENYARAIQQSGVKHVVNLSTIGGHLEKGSGLLLGAHQVENILNRLEGVSITHMRPTSFYYNLYGFAATIKKKGIITSNYGDKKVPWVSPTDIATAIAEELIARPVGRKVRYVASDELNGQEVATILGEAMGKPDLKWIIITDDEMQHNYEAIGMNPNTAAGLVEMYASLQTGLLSEDYYRHRPAVMGATKMKEFAKEFAAAIQQN